MPSWMMIYDKWLRRRSSMSFAGSHWCRSTPSFEHRLTETDEHRSTSVSPHREVASCATVRILTHKEFAANHPHPPKPFHIKKSDINRRPPMTYRVQLPKTDEARLNALRNPSQPSEHMADNFE
ncbi:hypothetical protein F2Q70_00011803 [Brassica cretica]|uniref:Uncharacterized protein n=1 Tax=Brassica cretica TaxID=69181 RepID=A0A8S9MD97_BRACR|nr:hypothetical protein F2Q70_00011803 [Brassica cretica]KAF3546654.1 hypothetical protein DY000_02007271 [Brassica cretica]